jgi:hypothetical protein
MKTDGTRVVFWIDLAVLLLLAFLLVTRKWDYIVALLIALVILNYFDHWWSRHRPQG